MLVHLNVESLLAEKEYANTVSNPGEWQTSIH